MPRKALVATACVGHMSGRPTITANHELAAELLDRMGGLGADLACLPEEFTLLGLPPDKEEREKIWEPIPGPTSDLYAEKARQHGMYVAAGMCEVRGNTRLNTSVLFGRQGEIVGQYDKIHPTLGELEAGTVPGVYADMPVFETDFGRVGMLICFDVDYPEEWARLGAAGAELVVFPSMCDGGLRLRAYAWLHTYIIVSSVSGGRSRIINKLGDETAASGLGVHVAHSTVDLEAEVFHYDQQYQQIRQMQTELGHRVTIVGTRDDGVFMVESNDDAWPMSRLKSEYGLENWQEYHDRSTHEAELVLAQQTMVTG
jgi:predicted amidohydrolase